MIMLMGIGNRRIIEHRLEVVVMMVHYYHFVLMIYVIRMFEVLEDGLIYKHHLLKLVEL